jgi:hypothetical protein
VLFDDVDVVTLVDVDGAPAARFAKHLRELIEGAVVLQDVSR